MAEVISRLSLMVVSVLSARYLTAGPYGQLNFAFALTSAISLLTDYGFPNLVTRDLSRNMNLAPLYLRRITHIKFIFGLVYLGMLSVICLFLTVSVTVKLLVIISGAYYLLMSYNLLYYSVLRAAGKMDRECWLRTVKYLLLGGLVLMAVLAKSGILIIISAYLVSEILSLFLTVAVTARIIPSHISVTGSNGVSSGNLLKSGLPFALTVFFTTVYYKSGSLAVSAFADYKEVSWFSIAFTIATSIQLLSLSIGNAVYPILSNYFSIDRVRMHHIGNRLLSLSLVFLIPAAALVMIASRPVIILLYGREYAPATLSLNILIIAEVFVYFSTILGTLFNASDRQSTVMKTALACAILNIMLTLAWTPKYGHFGASLAYTVTEGAALLILSAVMAGWLMRIRNAVRAVFESQPIERLTPGTIEFRRQYADHMARYAFANRFVTGKSIMDIACGSGYGSYYLAGTASHVTGADISSDAIRYADSHFRRDNLTFICRDAVNNSIRQKFDCIVSFETIEHIREDSRFLANLKRCLKPKGLLIISSPNGKTGRLSSPYHVREYSLPEFRSLLKRNFQHIHIYGQGKLPGMNEPRTGFRALPGYSHLVRAVDVLFNHYPRIEDVVVSGTDVEDAGSFIAVCS